jgi:hypothetical protein
MRNNAIDREVQDGLDFILNHFQEPLFPRKIMTRQLGYQVEVFSKEEALEYFKDSNYEDCRINAYPSFTEYRGINTTPVSFLMVDLDLKDIADEKKKGKAALDRVLNKTLQKITESIGGTPAVLWTGNGYHVYQAVNGFILEEYETFNEFTKYVERIPGSLNSKCISKGEDAEVKIIQRWDGVRPSIQPLLEISEDGLFKRKLMPLKS